jgi:ArsR family transcriptional regulator
MAAILAAMGTEPRLRIVRLLLSAHPDGLVVGDIQDELGINGSTLSHHLERLRHVGLIQATREGTFLRYAVNSVALEAVITFLYAECCQRSKAVEPGAIRKLCRC